VFEIVLLSCMLVMLVVSGACSATETALFGLTQADRTALAARHPHAHRAASHAMRSPRGTLITILVLNTTVNVTYFVFSSLLSGRSGSAGGAAAIGVASLVAIIALGEVLPKLLANAHRVAFSIVLAPIVVAAARAMGPLRVLLDSGVVAPLARVLVPREQPPALRTDELESLLEAAGAEGLIEREDHRLLGDVVALNQLRVRDVMTPRGDMPWVDARAGARDVADEARRSRRATLAVCEVSPDEGVIGLVKVREALGVAATRAERTWDLRKLIAPPAFVPDRSRMDRLLEFFRESRTDTAICVDETGAVTGMVALDDVIRALGFAPIEGGTREHERVERVGPGQWIVSGRLPVHDWADLFGAGADAASIDRRASTVAGLVLVGLGRLPSVGDEVLIGRLRLRVESMAGRSVERVLVTLAEGATSPDNP
jgi:putative hemolysin